MWEAWKKFGFEKSGEEMLANLRCRRKLEWPLLKCPVWISPSYCRSSPNTRSCPVAHSLCSQLVLGRANLFSWGGDFLISPAVHVVWMHSLSLCNLWLCFLGMGRRKRMFSWAALNGFKLPEVSLCSPCFTFCLRFKHDIKEKKIEDPWQHTLYLVLDTTNRWTPSCHK